MSEQQEFLNAIAANPEDELLRGVYSDWLLEHDQPEEAERQRKYVPAMKWLKGFANRWNFFEANHAYEYPAMGSPPNEDAVTSMIEEAVRKDGGYVTAMGIDLHGADELGPGDEQTFWESVEIVTGKRFDQNHRENFTWSCSC